MFRKFASFFVLIIVLATAVSCQSSETPLPTPVFPTSVVGETAVPPTDPTLEPTTPPVATVEPPAPTAPLPTAPVPTVPAPTATTFVPAGPPRIEFAPGGTSTTVSDSLAAGATQQYVLRADAEQVLAVGFSASPSGAVFRVLAAGMPLADFTPDYTTFILPTTGDFIIEVHAHMDTSYDLLVTIPPRVELTAPERITFDPGATSAHLTGSTTNAQIKQYVAGASVGQLLSFELFPDSDAYYIVVRGADGQHVLPIFVGASPGTEFRLPITQDYTISLIASLDAVPTRNGTYNATLSIVSEPVTLGVYELQAAPERVTFAPGSISTTQTGILASRKADSYIIGAAEGQVLVAKVTSSSGQVGLAIRDADGGQYVSYGMIGGGSYMDATLLVLPFTHDYYIEPFNVDMLGYDAQPNLDYSLTVTVVNMPEAAEVQFAPGATSATLPATLAYPGVHVYEFTAGGGQTMALTVSTASPDVAYRIDDLTVDRVASAGLLYGLSQPRLALDSGTEVYELPSNPPSQRFRVIVATAGIAADYSFTLAIE